MDADTVEGGNGSRSYAVQWTLAVILALLFGVMIPGTAAAASGSNEQPYPISASLAPGLRDYLTVETSSDVFNVQYHYGRVTPAANGAYLSNTTAPRSAWYIEDQRYGDTDVIAGVLHDDVGLIKTGLKMFDFGLYREAPNGSFPGSFGLFHGVAMFLAAAAPAMLVLQNWDRLSSQMGGGFLKHMNWEINRMDAAARQVMDTWWNKPGHIDDGSKEERLFEAALALEATGWLAHDGFLRSRAEVYARNGIRMTQPDGVWTEHGLSGRCCHDSTYQAIGLVYGTRYLELTDGTPEYANVYPSVSKGEKWEISRVRSNGTIITTGDSRTSGCAERSQVTGKCKTTDLEAIFSALMRWGVIANSQQFRSAAGKVWKLNLRKQQG